MDMKTGIPSRNTSCKAKSRLRKRKVLGKYDRGRQYDTHHFRSTNNRGFPRGVGDCHVFRDSHTVISLLGLLIHLPYTQISTAVYTMAQQAEEAFARTLLSTISTQPVTYPDDYQQPPGNSLKRVPVLQVVEYNQRTSEDSQRVSTH